MIREVFVKTFKKCIAILLYLLLMALFFQFDLLRLFDLKQICLVLIGTVILYLPHISREAKRLDKDLIGQSAMMGSLIACFVLIFTALSKSMEQGKVFSEIALACRPLFYGFCIWVMFGEESDGRQEEEEREEEPALEDYRRRLQELGLTKRETEVSLLVIQGLSNGEVAQELFISETTVKKHLSNVFAKLEIGGRDEIKERCRMGSDIKTP